MGEMLRTDHKSDVRVSPKAIAPEENVASSRGASRKGERKEDIEKGKVCKKTVPKAPRLSRKKPSSSWRGHYLLGEKKKNIRNVCWSP